MFQNTLTSDFVGHEACRFGEWYYHGDGKSMFSSLPSYAKIEEPHIGVHESVKKAITCIERNDCVEKSQEIIDIFRDAEMKSNVLFEILTDLLREAQKRIEGKQ